MKLISTDVFYLIANINTNNKYGFIFFNNVLLKKHNR